MIITHIAWNIIFIAFLIMSLINIKNVSTSKKTATFKKISCALGILIYIVYWIVLIMDYSKSGFDYQSFTILLLAWAMQNAAYVISDKKQRV